MRKPVAIALGILVLAVGMATSGCGGGSDAEAESPPTTAVDISQFRAAFMKAYGTAPHAMQWYGLVTEMKMADNRILDVTTNLAPRSSFVDGSNAWAICGAAVGLAVDLGLMNTRIRGVQMRARDGSELGGCA